MVARHPEGNGFFSIGIDVVAPSGATYVEGREFMFRDLPARTESLPRIGASTTTVAAWGRSAAAGSIMVAPSIFTPPTSSANSAPIGASAGARRQSQRLEAWGFNTIGNWSDPELWAMHRLPYTVPLSPEGEYAKVSSGEDWWGHAGPFRSAVCRGRRHGWRATRRRGSAATLG